MKSEGWIRGRCSAKLTSPSGMIPRMRSAVGSNESKAKRPYESPTKKLVPSSFAGHHLENIGRFVVTGV